MSGLIIFSWQWHPKSTHIICSCREIRKLLCIYPLLSRGMSDQNHDCLPTDPDHFVFELEFCSPINTVKVMLSQSFNLNFS